MESILDTLYEMPYMSILLDIIKISGSGELLSGDGPYTLFAPDDGAFLLLPKDDLMKLKTDQTLALDFLRDHISTGMHHRDDLKNGYQIISLSNNTYPVKRDEYNLQLGISNLVGVEQVCSNGIIQMVDLLLSYPE